MKTTAMAFGSFDVLHPGHIMYLSRAAGYADRLIVVIARDRTIEVLKHRKPVFDQSTRAKMVGMLKMVDKVVIGNKVKNLSDRYLVIKKYKPDVIVFGYDQRVSADDVRKWLRENGLKARVVRIKEAADTNIFKSSKVKSKLAQQ